MAQIDLSLDDKKAQAWVDEVNAELELVQNLITKVDAFMDEIADETDPVMVIMKNASRKIGVYGNIVKKTFTEACSGLKKAVSSLLKRQAEILEAGSTYVNSLGGN